MAPRTGTTMASRRRLPIALLAVALLTSGCLWVGYGFDDDNSRTNPHEHVIGPDNVGDLEERWRIDGIDGMTATPTAFGDEVYFGAWDGSFRAVNARTGTLLWQTALSSRPIDASARLHGNDLFVGDADGYLHALDRLTGAVHWSVLLDSHPDTSIYSSPVTVDDLVIIGVASIELARLKEDYTFRGSVVALDRITGDEVWRFYTTNDDATSGAGVSVWSSAALDRSRGLLYIGTGNAYEAPAGPLSDSLIALDYTTGELEWKRQFTEGDVFTFWNQEGPDADIGAAPNLFTIDGRDVVGVGDKAGNYAVFDRDDGELIWTRTLPEGNRLGGIMTTAAYADGVLYLSSNQWTSILNFHAPGNVSKTFALDAATGDTIWETDIPSPAFNALTYANGVVYQTSVKGTAYALDAATGAVLWSVEPGADLGGGITIRGGIVYIGYGFTFIGSSAGAAGGLVAYSLP